jgi:hypothetical protein
MLTAWLMGPSRRQRSLAAAFIGEIAAILRSIDQRPDSQGIDDPSRGSTLPQVETCRFDMPALPKFTIYEANAKKIADFDKRTARELAYFYTCLSTLSERLRTLSSQIDLADRNRCIRLVNSDSECVLEAGDQVLRQLRPFVSRKHSGSITRA